MLTQDLLAHYRRICQETLTVVDVETTGQIDPSHRVIEISVLHASLSTGILDQRTTLINPERHVPARIVQFTGITQAMVNNAASATTVWPSWLPLIEDGILTGHNLSFDYAFLRQEYQRLGINFHRSEHDQCCTVQLARLMLPDLPSRRLPDLVDYFNLDIDQSHRAEADALACWWVAERLLSQIQQESDQVVLDRLWHQWIPLKLVASLLKCSQKQARSRLKEAEVESRVGRSGIYLYRRGQVEQLLQEVPRGSIESLS